MNKITRDNIKAGDVVKYIGIYDGMPKVGARGVVEYVRLSYVGVVFEEKFDRGWALRSETASNCGREFVFAYSDDDSDSVSKLKLVSKYKWIKMK